MTSPRALLAAHNIRPKKHFGQNFLTDPNIAGMIVERSEILPDEVVLEIGAGLGALTVPAALKAHKVIAIEKDRHIIGILKVEMIANRLSNVEIIEKDFLKLDLKAMLKTTGQKIVVLGNLPYNISSQVLVRLVSFRKMVSRAVLMFQKEMAQRITANPGCKSYGRITVMLKYCSGIKKIADINASSFYPKPKVDSEVLEIKFKRDPEYAADDETFLFKVVKAAFGNRRKTLKNALFASNLGIEANDARVVLERSEIDPMRRAETLNIEEFVRLSNNIAQFLNKPYQSE
ncbi:MAG: ribosomal RNA small subunit methyltransferase A [Desulfobacterales bacterium]|nr:MAG: ribosomal RNA small subunit methyltransferase A [Desulfobacterales bacterium]UCD90225.1 MAG: ribosomal RNA small subunit methyltransferase A [Desulfobacterales bacterium]